MSRASTHLDLATGNWLVACPPYPGRILLPRLRELLRSNRSITLHFHEEGAKPEFIVCRALVQDQQGDVWVRATVLYPSPYEGYLSPASLGLAPFVNTPQPWLGGLYSSLMTSAEAAFYGLEPNVATD